MKKTLIAAALSAAVAAPALAQSNVTLYGVVDLGIARHDTGAARTTAVDSGLQSGSRFGLRGTEDLGGGLNALFVLENGFSADTGVQGQGALFGRQAFVGLGGGFGTLRLGRQYNPIRSALESVDPFAFGLAGNISSVFNAYGERANNTINYAIPKIGGFTAQVALSLGEVAGNTSANRQVGFSTGYSAGPLHAVLSYHHQELFGGTPAVASGEANTTMLGLVYDLQVVKVHGAFASNRGENAAGVRNVNSRDMMLGASVPFGPGTLLASVMRKDDRQTANADAQVVAVGYTHALSKRTNLYTSYARARNEAAARVNLPNAAASAVGQDPSTFNVGVRHRF